MFTLDLSSKLQLNFTNNFSIPTAITLSSIRTGGLATDTSSTISHQHFASAAKDSSTLLKE